MNPNFEDPNNHAPEVNPDDGWGDDAAQEPVPQPVAEPAGKPSAPRKKRVKKEDPADSRPAASKAGSTKSPGETRVSQKAKFEDPNNHAPEVSPVDDWGDATPDASPVLPQKRGLDEKPAGYAAKPDDDAKGIEIGVKVIERPEDRELRGPVQRLEVQEHVPKLLAPETTPLPKIVPKQVIAKPEVPEGEQQEEQWRGRAPDAENWGKQKSVSMRWIVISGFSLAIAVIAGVLILPHMGWKNEGSVRAQSWERVELPMLENAGEGNSSTLEEGIEEKAKVLVEAYATATGVDQVLPLVRDRARVEAALRERWQPMGVPADWHVPDDSKWEILKTGDLEYGYLAGLLPDITPFRFYIVQEGDKALLDWEASSGYSETRFGNLAKKQGEGGVVRGFISPGDLYTFSVPEKDYQCFRITSPDAATAIWGYAKRTEPVAEKLVALFRPGAIPREMLSEYPVTLELSKAPEESLPNQWLITEMLHMEWISP